MANLAWILEGFHCDNCGCSTIIVDQGRKGDYLYYCAHKGCRNHAYSEENDLYDQDDCPYWCIPSRVESK